MDQISNPEVSDRGLRSNFFKSFASHRFQRVYHPGPPLTDIYHFPALIQCHPSRDSSSGPQSFNCFFDPETSCIANDAPSPKTGSCAPHITMPSATYVMPSTADAGPDPLISERPVDEARPLKVIYVGAGISGIMAAIRMPEKVQNLDLTIYDKNPEVGGTYHNKYYERNVLKRPGTWWENRYPGCACG